MTPSVDHPLVVRGTTPRLSMKAPAVKVNSGGRVAWPDHIRKTPIDVRDMRILCLLPVRTAARAALGLAAIQAARSRESKKHSIEYFLVADSSDPDLSDILAAAQLQSVPVLTGDHTSKIEACNTVPHDRFDILVSLSDDMLCVRDGWDDVLVDRMEHFFPNYDGVLIQNDGFRHDLATLPILGVNHWKRMGHVYHRDYRSLYADDELGDAARALGKCQEIPDHLFLHEHPAWGLRSNDALYIRNEAPKTQDERIYRERKSRNFDLPEVTLSILMPSLTWRRDLRRRVLSEINHQISQCSDPLTVEVIVEADSGESPIGAKRNRCLERARGKYVCFIDDDDRIPPYYLQETLAALTTWAPDIVSWWGVITKNGEDASAFVHSRGRVVRSINSPLRVSAVNPPNHLNPVRRDLAMAAGFPANASYSEDWAYAERLAPLLRTERFIDKCMYFYDWVPSRSSASIGEE